MTTPSKLTPERKKEIQSALTDYVKTFSSQRQAADSISDCSEATLINMLSKEPQGISDDKWRTVAKQIGVGQKEMVLIQTMDFDTMILYYSLAKEEGCTFAIVGNAGYGKSRTAKYFADNNRGGNVYRLVCAEYWNPKHFLSELMQAMGRKDTGMSKIEMMKTIISDMRRKHQPLVILDEVDKLSDPCLIFFITLYNELNTLCGFIWQSTDNIEKRMTKGVNANRRGYKELKSRIGNSFITLRGTSISEITAICKANGIEDAEEIHKIHNECGGDLRRVERNELKRRAKAHYKPRKVA